MTKWLFYRTKFLVQLSFTGLCYACCISLIGAFSFSTKLFAETEIRQSPKLNVVTTFTIIQDMAAQVAGDRANVQSIVKLGAEIHDYQPTPQDIRKIQHADLVLYNGLHLEQWFEKFFKDIPNVPTVVVTEGITPLPIDEWYYKHNEANTDQSDPGLPDIQSESNTLNPHAWMSPSNAIIYVENIRDAFIKYDPNNADEYARNAEQYIDSLKALITQTQFELRNVPSEKRWLITSEGAFGYLAKEFSFKEAYLFPINSEQQTSPQQMRRLIDLINQYEIPVIFSESTLSDKPAKKISEETNAQYGGMLYVDSLSEVDGPVPHFYDLLKVSLQTVTDGFTRQAESR